MRGKVWLLYHRGEFLRITPAYAGKRKSIVSLFFAMQDHPRLCGEKVGRGNYIFFHKGSPPPMRGKVNQKQLPVDTNGITPAYAGKRSASRGRVEAVRDHPRLCGEKHGDSVHSRLPFRITPAYAGKSSFVHIKVCGCKDHPRLCGEKESEEISRFGNQGSPPPMRGKVTFARFS